MVRGWRGGSTAATIALAVVVAMGLGFGLQQAVAPGLHYLGLARQQAVQRDAWVLQQLPGRIAGLLDVLDATPEAQRTAVIAIRLVW